LDVLFRSMSVNAYYVYKIRQEEKISSSLYKAFTC